MHEDVLVLVGLAEEGDDELDEDCHVLLGLTRAVRRLQVSKHKKIKVTSN